MLYYSPLISLMIAVTMSIVGEADNGEPRAKKPRCSSESDESK